VALSALVFLQAATPAAPRRSSWRRSFPERARNRPAPLIAGRRRR
jgi:hypothetical protein